MNSYQSARSGSATTDASPVGKSETVLGNVIDELGAMEKRAAMVADRLQRVIDRAFGRAPTAQSADAKDSPKAVPPNGIVEVIQERLVSLANAIGDADRIITRLDGLV